MNRDANHGTAAHRRSPKQEKSLAKLSGGYRTPGSGSKDQKGDVKKAYRFVRIEAKTTKHDSFRVTKEMWQKIEDAALPNREIPAIIVEFIDLSGRKLGELAVVPAYAIEFLENPNV